MGLLRWTNLVHLKPNHGTITYGRYSMLLIMIYVWNHFQSCLHNVIIHELSRNKLRDFNNFFPKQVTNRPFTCIYKLSVYIK